ncbi:hypothetical protein H311_01267, partial [Anncaliia algerae PRA109]
VLNHIDVERILLRDPYIALDYRIILFHQVKVHKESSSRCYMGIGIIDTSPICKQFSIKVITNRYDGLLLPIIARIVRPGSTIHTDEWTVYRGLKLIGTIINNLILIIYC